MSGSGVCFCVSWLIISASSLPNYKCTYYYSFIKRKEGQLFFPLPALSSPPGMCESGGLQVRQPGIGPRHGSCWRAGPGTCLKPGLASSPPGCGETWWMQGGGAATVEGRAPPHVFAAPQEAHFMSHVSWHEVENVKTFGSQSPWEGWFQTQGTWAAFLFSPSPVTSLSALVETPCSLCPSPWSFLEDTEEGSR